MGQDVNEVSVVVPAKKATSCLNFLATIPRVIFIEKFSQPVLLDTPRRKFVAGIPPGQSEKPVMSTMVDPDLE
jgi:hypothetical protein